MIETDTNEVTENTLSLIFTNAHRISRRASVGWALLDDFNVLLVHNSTMAGTNPTKLADVVNDFRDSLSHLILSVEPCALYCDVEALIHQIEFSSCSKITLGYQLPNELKDRTWTKWLKQWNGEVNYAGYSAIGENLAAGIKSMLEFKRPWVTAISASTIENKSLSLSNLQHEFGFSAYLSNLSMQNGAILFNPTQKEIVENLPKVNRAGQVIYNHCVEDINEAQASLEECTNRNLFSVLILCDPSKLSLYAELNLVDEIYHHIAIANVKQGNVVDAPEFLKLDNWTIASSDVVGNCIRMSIRKNNNLPKVDERLRHRLN